MLRGGPLSHIWQRLSERYHDWRLGVFTRGFRSPVGYATSVDCQAYEPLEYESIRRALNEVRFDNPQALLDYGAGMGRVLALASTLPFRRLVGVELSAELCGLARENMQRRRDRGVHLPCEIVQADAATFEVPSDVTVCFLYNPFVGVILEQVVRQIERSVQAAPRSVLILHVRLRKDPNPFLVNPAVQHVRTLPVFLRPAMALEVYKAGRSGGS